jgi:hypothetical protein
MEGGEMPLVPQKCQTTSVSETDDFVQSMWQRDRKLTGPVWNRTCEWGAEELVPGCVVVSHREKYGVLWLED